MVDRQKRVIVIERKNGKKYQGVKEFHIPAHMGY